LLAAVAYAGDSLPWRGRIVFDERVRVDDATGPANHPATHPQTVMDENWNLYTVWADDRDNDGQYEVFFALSRDTGRTWSVPNVNLSQGPSQYYLFPWLAADRTGLYVVWQSWSGNSWTLLFTRSTDQGTSWATPVEVPGITVVNNLNSGINFGPQPKLAVDSKSNPDSTFLYLLWADNATGAIQIKLARSTDLGVSFVDMGIVDNNLGSVNRNPFLAVDDSGWVHCAWARGTSGSNQDPHCWIGYSRSSDRGSTFLADDIIVNDDVSGVYRGNPSITYDPLYGNVLVSWEDSRRAGGNANPDIWFSHVHRDSLIPTPNQRVNWWEPDTSIRYDNFKPVIRMDPRGIMVAAWHADPEADNSYGIYLAAYADTLGRFTGSRSLVETFTGISGANFGNSFYPPSLFVRALIDPTGQDTTTHFFIVWQDFREDSLGGNIYSVHGRVVTRPPWPYGWHEVRPPVPSAPSTMPVKDGGWLAMNENSGLICVAKGNKCSDFYSYDPMDTTASAWVTLAPWPNGTEAKPPYKGSCGISDNGGHIYAIKGNNTVGFYRYDVAPDSWKQLTDVPFGTKKKKVKGGADMAYVPGDTDYVYLLKGYKNEFYRYSPTANTWDTLPLAPADKYINGSWIVYDGDSLLYTHQAKGHGFYAFNVKTKAWGAALSGMPLIGMMGKSKKSKDGGAGAWYSGHIYALKGGNTCEFWRYDADTNAWTEKETMPQFGSTLKKKKVKGGGDLVSYGDWWAFFALKGNKTLELWRYVDSTPPAAAAPPHRGGPSASGLSLVNSRMTIAPNPLRSGFATVRWSGGNSPHSGTVPGRLAVYDASGRCVLRTSFGLRTSPLRLDLRALGAGVYLVKLSVAGLSSTQKLVLQH
jgi:hypothetical protein